MRHLQAGAAELDIVHLFAPDGSISNGHQLPPTQRNSNWGERRRPAFDRNLLFARKVGPALVTGNTIVVKPHKLMPLATLMLVELSRRAGLPECVLNVVTGDGRNVGASSSRTRTPISSR